MKNSFLIIFICFFFIFITHQKSYCYFNKYAETGLIEIPTAETAGSGHLSFVSFSNLLGWDDDYYSQIKDIYIYDQYLSVGYCLNPYFETSLTQRMHTDITSDKSYFSIGDTRVSAKLIYPPYTHKKQFDLAINIAINFPTGSSQSGYFKRRIFYNDKFNFTAGDTFLEFLFPMLVNFTEIGKGAPIKAHLFFGAIFTTTSQSYDMFRAGGGLEYIPTNYTSLFLEINGETKAKKGLSPDSDPLWLSAGINLKKDIFQFKTGAKILISAKNAFQQQYVKNNFVNTGLYPKTGLFATLAFSGIVIEQDIDKDGIEDKKDKCPNSPEDIDGYLDNDGCPDFDNDKDGIKDIKDKCPNIAEDMDGYNDIDGCPDFDNDKDGIYDTLDKCPNTPEDMDGFEDNDGCPEIDNDKDGINDSKDRCPNKKEDFDGFNDTDGCPDFDNDKDGIYDSLDRCPLQKETFNGYEDTDGCPDGKIKLFKKNTSIILEDVKFQKNNQLGDQAKDMIKELILFMKYHDSIKIEIRVHCDALGSIRQNNKKTQKQAIYLKNILVKSKINPDRIKAVGIGEKYPIATNATAQGRYKNNRVEILRIE